MIIKFNKALMEKMLIEKDMEEEIYM